VSDRDNKDDLSEFGLDGAERTTAPRTLEENGSRDAAADALSTLLSPALRQAIAKRAAAQAPVVQSVKPAKTKLHMLGFGPVTIPPFSAHQVYAQPGVVFRGEKIIYTGDKDNLLVDGIFVGKKPQFPNVAFPIAVDDLTTPPLHDGAYFATCDQASFIMFNVRNTGPKPRNFCATVVGRMLL
jgi:hypothetical protein